MRKNEQGGPTPPMKAGGKKAKPPASPLETGDLPREGSLRDAARRLTRVFLHDAGEGLLGDTVFLDLNGNSTPDAGEGMEGVVLFLDLNHDGLFFLSRVVRQVHHHCAFLLQALLRSRRLGLHTTGNGVVREKHHRYWKMTTRIIIICA